MRINDNIWTGVKYMNGLLFKSLYATGLAWLGQGLGTKGTSMKQGKTGMGGVKFLRSPSNCQDSIRSKIDPLLLLRLHSDHPPILQHYANQNPELRVPPKPSDTFSIALWTPNDLGKPRSHFCLHLSSSFHFSPLELRIRSHVFVSVFTFPFSIY